MSLDPAVRSPRLFPHRLPLALAPLALVLAGGVTGCFRATGVGRPTVAVEEIPASGGDRLHGLKATSGPGDFYLGNDAVQIAVDGAAFGNREGQFGAPSGGAILDVGNVALDQNYKRVSLPTDMVERLGPVVNQDPDLPLVFDRYSPGTGVNEVYLDMQGYLLDPKGKLGVATDAQGKVLGVSVTHRITLNKANTYFTLETTITNEGTSALPIRNLGDFLSQHGGGFRFVVPAVTTFDGTPISSWGVEIPGSDFTAPLTTSVVTPMVALMGSESSGDTLDAHSTLGILPLDVDQVLVASDPQPALTELRPRFPGRLVVGSPAATSLPAGQPMTYRRRLYVLGGEYGNASISGTQPAQATTIFNEMVQARLGFQNGEYGILIFDTFGTAARTGPLQTEFRFDRYTGPSADPSTDADPSHWVTERVEWREPSDIPSSGGALGVFLPTVADARGTGLSQPYRVTARNAFQSNTLYLGTNTSNADRPYLPTPITPSKSQIWTLAENLSPERAEVTDASGNVVRSKQQQHAFLVRQAGTLEVDGLDPLRITLAGQGGAADPSMKRSRRLAGYYDRVYKAKVVSILSTGLSTSVAGYQYTAGNQVFGTSFRASGGGTSVFLPPGDYLAYGTRGPLSHLDALSVKSYDGQTDLSHTFVTLPPTLPTGWKAFDVPSPTQATTGGLNPGEMLSSALAEGVDVVARTEEDHLTDPTALRTEFRMEIESAAVTDAQRVPIGIDPLVVGARSSTLADGFVTALFTPAPNGDRNGGARPSKGWTLADFITQAEGRYNIVHRPRGPQGLFTVRGFDPAVPLGSGANAWWTQTGPVSLGAHQGDFDALELIRAEGCDPADPTAWFAEFKAVRSDWFSLLSQQAPTAFTKALGLSASKFSYDTPVGLARTYLKLGSGTLTQDTLDPLLAALRSGAAVASTGPLLDVAVNGVGPGRLVAGPAPTVSITISLYAADWVPVDEVRVVVNGVAQVVPMSSFTASSTDFRLRMATLDGVAMPTGKDAWLVVEAGVPLATTGAYQAGTPWNKIMKGIYPLAVTNPIFVDVDGGGYTPPGL